MSETDEYGESVRTAESIVTRELTVDTYSADAMRIAVLLAITHAGSVMKNDRLVILTIYFLFSLFFVTSLFYVLRFYVGELAGAMVMLATLVGFVATDLNFHNIDTALSAALIILFLFTSDRARERLRHPNAANGIFTAHSIYLASNVTGPSHPHSA